MRQDCQKETSIEIVNILIIFSEVFVKRITFLFLNQAYLFYQRYYTSASL